MLLCDMHCHSSGISTCCRISYKQAIDEAKAVGFSALVLTNHYCSAYTKNTPFEEWVEKYVEEYRSAKAYGVSVGVKIFFGVEITVNFNPQVHLLLYGISPEQLKNATKLYEKSLSELYAYAKENGFTLIQAHPFRNGTTVLDTNLLDGVEINCHPLYDDTHSKELIDIAQKNGISVTCGCDYHGDVCYRPQGGMSIPDEIDSEKKLAEYLKNTSSFSLQIHELRQPIPYRTEVTIRRKR